jgi:hypothetical protein
MEKSVHRVMTALRVTPPLKTGGMVARRAVSGKRADNQKCE